MADNDKQYFQWLDIPNGSGGKDRKWAKDAEARAAIEKIDPSSNVASVDTCMSIIGELI